MIAGLLILFNRPTTTPYSLLVLYGSLLMPPTVLLSCNRSVTRNEYILIGTELSAGLSAITSILLMPMRNPVLPNDDISRPFEPPDPRLRSPEDNLSLWQFMTVSWMAPLISRGSARQLNEEDVWSLSYEFQHRKLHDTFRELKGSVLRRVVFANALDLILVSILGIVELLASTVDCWNLLKEAAAKPCNRLLDTCVATAAFAVHGEWPCAQTCRHCLCCLVLSRSPHCWAIRRLQSVVQ